VKSIKYIYECLDPNDLRVNSLYERRSGVNSKDEFERGTHFHLAHFTTSTLLESI
jgi:hypothetical protein